jgi:hypothetical protein
MNNEIRWTFEGLIKPGKLESLYDFLEGFAHVTEREKKVINYEF